MLGSRSKDGELEFAAILRSPRLDFDEVMDFVFWSTSIGEGYV